MTIQQLLEKLERKRDSIDAAISEIRSHQVHTSTRKKAAAIIKSVRSTKKPKSNRGYDYNGMHWTQTPEGKKKIAAISKARWKALKG